ncbi:hypothetical protein LSTR_LSTR005897 [Laodelphax striatellus]|uniref:C2H2-type domain-containing protein n=1 Tax=Laodelphax striatellus TaxID=195883 RepID=A0A482WSD5_LAOST|nr:hypothetical protein LSTR_LSTR005897 [Laodelphax striatellus]
MLASLEMASLSVEVMNRCVPIIVILGGTGTGKSKLGIQIAKRIGGEIISADSMQVYKGLDILTNKVTEEEKDGVVHHLLDFVEPPRTYTVVDFRNEALPIVDKLLAQKRCPVIVGGTNYYIESLLWKVLVTDTTKNNVEGESNHAMEQLAFKLGLRPFSGNFKRKADEEDKAPLDAMGRFVLTVREVSLMCGYPAKVLRLLFDKLESCKETACKELDSTLGSSICENLANIDYQHCTSCQAIKNYAIEVVNLRKQTEDLAQKWQSSHPTLNLARILRTQDKLKLKDLSESEESLKEVHQQLKLMLTPWVKKLETEYGSNYCLEIDVDDVPSPDLHNFLNQVDRHQARILHPNNKRKIIRSLCVWAESGRKHSEILKEQKQGGSLGGPLRYKNVIIFWLTCDQKVLEQRLDERIDEMFDRGLIQELIDFHNKFKPDEDEYTRGIFQSIGFRNFREFLMMDDEGRRGPEGDKMFQKGREAFSIDTKRYVRIQNKWVRNRFLNCITREVPPVYKLSTTDLDRWTEQVLEPAMEVVMSKMEAAEGAEAGAARLQPLAPEAAAVIISSEKQLFEQKHELRRCEICDRVFIGQMQFEVHLGSAKHKKTLERRERQKIQTVDT